jgi:hypothetical protein
MKDFPLITGKNFDEIFQYVFREGLISPNELPQFDDAIPDSLSTMADKLDVVVKKLDAAAKLSAGVSYLSAWYRIDLESAAKDFYDEDFIAAHVERKVELMHMVWAKADTTVKIIPALEKKFNRLRGVLPAEMQADFDDSFLEQGGKYSCFAYHALLIEKIAEIQRLIRPQKRKREKK